LPLQIGFLALFMVIPWVVTTYQTNILISFLLYVVLGLGLNVIVGVAGLLFLGHAAFYAIGAYSYALLNQYYGLGFWISLPIGGILAALAGVALAFPVLRLRGDYLAIVTLGFGEIVRLLLENWSNLTGGPSGISNIPRPGLLDAKLSVADANIYIYYIVLALAIITIIAVSRLKDSRIGRALQALREDEVACEAMGIDRVGVKLMAFGLGTAWAGFAGVVFAAKTTFINPASFTRVGLPGIAARVHARLFRVSHDPLRDGHGAHDGLSSPGPHPRKEKDLHGGRSRTEHGQRRTDLDGTGTRRHGCVHELRRPEGPERCGTQGQLR
jgi:branched-chain amino acid transport system permease protein